MCFCYCFLYYLTFYEFRSLSCFSLCSFILFIASLFARHAMAKVLSSPPTVQAPLNFICALISPMSLLCKFRTFNNRFFTFFRRMIFVSVTRLHNIKLLLRHLIWCDVHLEQQQQSILKWLIHLLHRLKLYFHYVRVIFYFNYINIFYQSAIFSNSPLFFIFSLEWLPMCRFSLLTNTDLITFSSMDVSTLIPCFRSLVFVSCFKSF